MTPCTVKYQWEFVRLKNIINSVADVLSGFICPTEIVFIAQLYISDISFASIYNHIFIVDLKNRIEYILTSAAKIFDFKVNLLSRFFLVQHFWRFDF